MLLLSTPELLKTAEWHLYKEGTFFKLQSRQLKSLSMARLRENVVTSVDFARYS